jgi:glyceraldehyde 3-phosphate dehydrogenase
MTTRVAINGFGRMGRAACRIVHDRDLDIDIVAVNELGNAETMANLLARDSVHGRFRAKVAPVEGGIEVDGRLIPFFAQADPGKLPWNQLGVDVVLEATGHFRTRATAETHLAAGARRVIVSAPCKDADATFVIGVNDNTFDPQRHHVVSNASCTTNGSESARG